MTPIITKFNDITGDFEITIPIPFTLKDGIEYADMMIADIPKYEDTKDYNVFDLIRENQELKKQLEEKDDFINKLQGTKYRLDKYDYERTMQQKEFIEWLEKMAKDLFQNEEYENSTTYCYVLSKYKEIIGYKE